MAKRKKDVAAEARSRRASAIEQMPEALQTVFTKILRMMEDGRTSGIDYYYRIGLTCLNVRRHPEVYVGNDGVPGLALLEQALSLHQRTLRACIRFVELYDDRQKTELLAMCNAEVGYALDWGHVRDLVSVADDDVRRELTLAAVAGCWDQAKLRKEIKARLGRSGRGQHRVPNSLLAQVEQMLKLSQTWLDKRAQVWDADTNAEDDPRNSIWDNITEAGVDDLDESLITSVEQLEFALQRLQVEAATQLDLCRGVFAYLQQVRQSREETDTEEQDEADASEDAPEVATASRPTAAQRQQSRVVSVGGSSRRRTA